MFIQYPLRNLIPKLVSYLLFALWTAGLKLLSVCVCLCVRLCVGLCVHVCVSVWCGVEHVSVRFLLQSVFHIGLHHSFLSGLG